MCIPLLWLLLLLSCGPVAVFHLAMKEGQSLLWDPAVSGVMSEAIQRLQEVFAIGELPPNTLPMKKPPQFMLDLYSRVADADGITKAPGLLQCNVVRSIESKVFPQSGHPPFIFNISSVRSNEKMLKAELRVFKWKPSGTAPKHHFCRVDLYELLDSASRPWRGNLISSRLLPLHSQGWEMFNVTQTVSRWIVDNGTNHGFLITSTLPSGNFLETDLLGLTKSQHRPGGKRSYLVLFNDDGRRGVSSSTMHSPAVEDTGLLLPLLETSSFLLPAPHKFPLVVDMTKSRRIREVYVDGVLPCQRHPLYVDFEEIGWAGWIISPKGYNAFHCKGNCLFPLGQGLGATNHATVQSIVHALKLNKDIATPCCVPNKLNSINLLYFDDEENVVLKQYEDMVAVSCGCH
ncbi:bone morphogenetic protein 2-like [Ascaphus truei]|uniref:bone morphogenetic protein 2-like n=1 Tax=Ascaphus truei TaxID=8439 RepID=UPI003F5A3DE3